MGTLSGVQEVSEAFAPVSTLYRCLCTCCTISHGDKNNIIETIRDDLDMSLWLVACDLVKYMQFLAHDHTQVPQKSTFPHTLNCLSSQTKQARLCLVALEFNHRV